jgi:hypothetical protein
MAGYLDGANQRTTECLDRNFVLQSDLVGVRDSLQKSQDKLHLSRRNNWIFGGISVFLFSTIVLITAN